MKGPTSKISRQLRANKTYGDAESEYMKGVNNLSGTYDVSGSTYVVFQDDTVATLRKMGNLRQRISDLKRR